MNKVILKGNVSSDITTRMTASGLVIASFSMAINEVRGSGSEKKEYVTFVDISAFGKRAEIIQKYVKKGDPFLMEGKLKLDRWETDDGQKRQRLGVVLDNFDLLYRKSNNEKSPDDTLDEDVPF
jgi:single-strand DNA-binding protein